MTQKERVLEYLKRYGSITGLEAFGELGCYRLSDQIFKLRNEGHEIETVYETKKNKWGEDVNYARYKFKDGDDENEQEHISDTE